MKIEAAVLQHIHGTWKCWTWCMLLASVSGKMFVMILMRPDRKH